RARANASTASTGDPLEGLTPPRVISTLAAMAGLEWHRSLVAAAAVTLVACDKAPAELAAAPSPAPTPAVAPLAWDAPGAWAKLDVPGSGDRKASYRVPKAGADKEDAEVTVLFYGTGSKGDPSLVFGGWLKQFDGDAASS